MRKLWFLPVVVLMLAGCSGQVSSSRTSAPVVEVAAVPDLVGLDGETAQDQLEDAGFKVEFDAGDDFVVLAKNWTVDSQEPAAGSEVESGSTVTLVVSKPEGADGGDGASDVVLSGSAAQVACDNRGESEFPYGWDPHWILGKIAEENRADGSWWFKVEVTVKNEFNAKRDVVVECTVAGTTDAPVVTDFLSY